jgi:CubicO group peptidase (beta-lactamase class C family)
VSSLSAGLDTGGLRRLHDGLAASTESGQVPALVVLLAGGDDVHTEVPGRPALHDPDPLRRDAIFRIASLSKPIAAADAVLLVDDSVLQAAYGALAG